MGNRTSNYTAASQVEISSKKPQSLPRGRVFRRTELRPSSMQRAISPVWVLASLAALSALACARGSGHSARHADGSYDLTCKGPLVDCLKQAERLCRDQGYTVESGHELQDKLGHESGQSQVTVVRSDATIKCGNASTERPPIKLERPPEPTPAPVVAPSAPAPACVPGATQACVGPGGCSGGQACAADGTRFERCECAAPSVPPASP
jgi:hypothetical protein